jgi:serine/threonine protein kinase
MMSLSPGTKLGAHEILAPIGSGGMGQVYRARDTRLGRDVAIKVSSERFTERFEREARAIASLNHPNICTLYDVGPNYLVMELVEGETLQGPVPLETAIAYARQITEALEAAHEKGIVHRDLKPAKIRISNEKSPRGDRNRPCSQSQVDSRRSILFLLKANPVTQHNRSIEC